MQLSAAVALLQHSMKPVKTYWADLGCGDGLFTNALSQLLTEESLICAVDKNKSALNKVSVKDRIRLMKYELDFINDDLPFTGLSGILMANAFHYIKNKKDFIHKIIKHLGPAGYFLLVEYDTDNTNPWIPYPLSFASLKHLFSELNCTTKKLKQVSSRYNGTIYSAIITPGNK
jgi:trans-aconitate methyltransferase